MREGASGALFFCASGWTAEGPHRYRRGMTITATIMNTATGQPIQKMSFGRMPKPWASFNLATGELVTAQRIDVSPPAPGKFPSTVHICVKVNPYSCPYPHILLSHFCTPFSFPLLFFPSLL